MELDFSEQIRSLHEMEELNLNLASLEEEISDDSWAEEKNKGKTLNKPFRTSGGPKKFSVYVKNKSGNVIKVNFGDPKMEIKRDDPARRKSFRARHNCSEKKDKTKAGYWSCKQWRAGTKVQGSDFDITDEEFDSILLDELDESEAGKTGLWDNIRKKKEREGKNYKAAKPGDKDRPDPKSFKKAQGPKKKSKALSKNDFTKDDFKPHAMYDKDGKKYMAKTYEDHLKMKKMGYTHESEVDQESDANQNSPRAYAGNYLEKGFMSHCASYDKDLVNTAGMDKDKTYATCAMQYKKMKSTLYEKGEGGLTEKQKKLPSAIQKSILKKQGKANQNSPRMY